jgi:arginine/glutamate-rich protein 1
VFDQVGCIRRRQHEAELKLIEEEASKRIELAIEKMVQEALDSEELRKEVERRLQEGRKKVSEDVMAQMEKEREEAALESQRKEASYINS